MIQKMHDMFNLVLDTYNEPYFIEKEIDTLINHAQVSLVTDVLFPDQVVGRRVNNPETIYEANKQASLILAPLLYTVPVSNSNNVLTNNSIKASLNTKIIESTGIEEDAYPVYIQSIKRRLEGVDTVNVNYVRNSDLPRFEDNVFKKPTENKQLYTIESDGLVIHPAVNGTYDVTLIKSPREVSLEDYISTDLPIISYPIILAYALSLAGVASRDDIFLKLQNGSGNGTER